MKFPAPRLQFRLLTLFIAISVFAVGAALVRQKWRRVTIHNELRRSFDVVLGNEKTGASNDALQQQRVRRDLKYSVQALYERGEGADPTLARHALEHVELLDALTTIHLFNLPIDDGLLEQLQSLPALRELKVGQGSSDEQIRAILESLPKLAAIDLSTSQIADPTGAKLASLRGLEDVNLTRTQVGRQTCAELGGLPRLTRLRLDGCPKINDDSLVLLARSRSLEEIYLWDTLCTDEGLIALAAIPSLKRLSAWDASQITELGVQRFRLLRPDVRVEWENPVNTAGMSD